eukprot:1945468-Prymnesium_polylepis.1
MDGRAVVGRLCVAMVLCGGGRSSTLCVMTVQCSACIYQGPGRDSVPSARQTVEGSYWACARVFPPRLHRAPRA